MTEGFENTSPAVTRRPPPGSALATAVPALEVQDAARAGDITSILLYRAKAAREILPSKSGIASEGQWVLPTDTKMFKPTEGAHSDSMITFVQDEHLRGETEVPDDSWWKAPADDPS